MGFRRLWEAEVFVLVGSLALEFLTSDLFELSDKESTKFLRSHVYSGEMVKILSKR